MKTITEQFVEEYMTPNPVTLAPEDNIAHAFRLNEASGLRHYPVVNEMGKVVGVISDRNLRRIESILLQVKGRMAELTEQLKVRDVMKPDVISVFRDTNMFQAAQIMIDLKLGALPVVEKSHLIGMLSYVDILDGFADLEADSFKR